jgi:hypothetical protein
LAGTYAHFISTGSAASKTLKDPPVSGLGNLALTILPQNPVSADVLAELSRLIQPSTNPDFNFDQFSARFGGGLVWAPGGGMFDWRLGYEYGLSSFEDDNFSNRSNHYHQINTRGRWRFLPRTALLYDATATFLRYNTTLQGQYDSDPIRARLGINGLVTSSFAILAMGGWGSSFYKGSAAQQYDGPIAQVELKWFVTPSPTSDLAAAALMNLSTIAIGYVRDFANSYLSDYYTINRGYANLSWFFGQRFTLSLNGGVTATTYPTIFDRNAPRTAPLAAGFTQTWVDAALFGEYRVAESVGINGSVRYSSASSHTVPIPSTPTSPSSTLDDLGWNRFEAFVGLRWFL